MVLQVSSFDTLYVTVGLLGYLGFLYGRYKKRELKREETIFYDLVENIIGRYVQRQYAVYRV